MSARPALATLALGSVLLALGSGCGAEAEASPSEPETAPQDAAQVQPDAANDDADGALHYDPRKSLAPLVDSVGPSVVSIHASGRGRGFFSPGTEGSGSGFVYASDGIIVTNHHVVDGAERIQVRMHDGTGYDAEVLGSDAATDLAVLELEGARDLPALELGNSADLRVGDWVVAIGNPMGLDHSASVGILSGRGRGSLGLYADSYLDFLQTDADIAPGSSGGPLFDLRGAVVGITTAVGANSRPGFAIPASQAQPVIEQLRATGSVRRGWLGAASERGAQEGRGAVIGEVYAGTPAADAGLRPGDVVKRVDRTGIDDFDGLRGVIATLEPGHTVLLEVDRDGTSVELTAVLGDRPDSRTMRGLRPAPQRPMPRTTPTPPTGFGERLGIGARSHADGLEVATVEEGSLAEDLDLQVGDVLIELNGVSIRDPADVRDALGRSRGKVEVSLLRDGVKHNVTLERS
ncbi:MAG: trypsin-like peptidase domain-containing protein [Nannocystaceae bacterium]|nr:trypsin-like peptidase domain-containing protein [bacterium]